MSEHVASQRPCKPQAQMMTTDEREGRGVMYLEDTAIFTSLPRDEDPEEHAYVSRPAELHKGCLGE